MWFFRYRFHCFTTSESETNPMGGVNFLKNLNSFELFSFTAGLRTLRVLPETMDVQGSDDGPSAEGTGRIPVSGHGEPERCLAVLVRSCNPVRSCTSGEHRHGRQQPAQDGRDRARGLGELAVLGAQRYVGPRQP